LSSVNAQFAINLLIIAVGWVVRRFLVGEEEGVALVRVTMNVTLPALIVSTFATMRFRASLALLPALAIAYGLMMVAVGLLVFRKLPRRERGQAIFLLPGFNIGLFAYPLVEGALGRDALQYLAMFDMGVAVISFVVVLAIGQHFAREPGSGLSLGPTVRAMLKTVPLIVYLVSVLLSAVGLRYPAPLVAVAQQLAQANMPLALLILGMYLRFDAVASAWRVIARILGVRYLVGLGVGVALYLFLPFSPLYRTVLLAALVLPPPLISLSYAVQLGYDARLVGALLNVANVGSFFLLWGIFNVVGPGPAR
jgi:malate permease and related proteins